MPEELIKVEVSIPETETREIVEERTQIVDSQSHGENTSVLDLQKQIGDLRLEMQRLETTLSQLQARPDPAMLPEMTSRLSSLERQMRNLLEVQEEQKSLENVALIDVAPPPPPNSPAPVRNALSKILLGR